MNDLTACDDITYGIGKQHANSRDVTNSEPGRMSPIEESSARTELRRCWRAAMSLGVGKGSPFCVPLTSARVKIRILLISTELDMFSQAEDCKFWGSTLESVGLWGNLRSQRPGTPSFMSVEISVYSIPNFYNYIL